MSTEFPSNPREPLEASLTALLLGELPKEQAAAVREAMEQDPELARQYEQLKATVEMIRQAETSPASAAVAQPTVMRLSDDRRQALLQRFKTVAPIEFVKPKSRRPRWLVPAGIAALHLGLLSAILLTPFSKPKVRFLSSTSGTLGKKTTDEKDLFARVEQALPSPTEARRKLNRNLAPAEQPAEFAQGPAKIVLPDSAGDVEPSADAEATLKGKVAAESERLAELRREIPVQVQSGGLGGGAVPSREGRSLSSSLDAQAGKPGLQRGDLLASNDHGIRRYGETAPVKEETLQRGSAETLAKSALAAPVVVVDPVTGLPAQNQSQSQPGAVTPNATSSWSVSSTMRGFYADNASAAGNVQSSDTLFTYKPEAASSPALVPPPLANNEDRAPLPSLGNEPSVGQLFQRQKSVNERQEPAHSDQGVAQPVETKFGLAFVAPSTQAPAIITNTGLGASLSDSAKSHFGNDGLVRSEPVNGTAAQKLVQLRDNNFSFGGEAPNTPGLQTSESRTSSAYEEKSRELKELQASSQLLRLKLASEGTDKQLPKNSMVGIVDRAVPAQAPSQGLLDRLLGKSDSKFQSTARVRVDADRSGIQAGTNTSFYDPYFLQTEFEVIQSDLILGRVVDKLNLRDAWAKEQGTGQKLGVEEAIKTLRQKLDLQAPKGTELVEIHARDKEATEAARIANAVAQEYSTYRAEQRQSLAGSEVKDLQERLETEQKKIASVVTELENLRSQTNQSDADVSPPKPVAPDPVPQPEVQTRDNAFSTFSLNVSDVSFKLAAAALEKGQMPEPGSIRAEEFINAFNYRDPEPANGAPFAFAWERARYAFAQNRDVLRLSLKTAAQGRQAGRPLNLVLLLDNSGSMERADRVRIIHEALRVLAAQLQAQDTVSVITFARTARLLVDGLPGDQAGQAVEKIDGMTPQGGTNLEEAMNLGYQTALRHYLAGGINHVVLLTDGAANLGNVDAESLKRKVEAHRRQGIALDCFGIGWEGFNDELLEGLSRNGDGRYGFINTPEEAAGEFASRLAGALQVAASDVKVQVEFNSNRVTGYRQVGYAKHQLTQEQFRDNTVDAAELAGAESGNAIYVLDVNPAGDGPLATVRVRFKVPDTGQFEEHEWSVPYTGKCPALEQSSPALRLSTTAAAFAEWLAGNPYASEVTPGALMNCLSGAPEVYGADPRPRELEKMIRQAKSLNSK